MSRPAQIMKNLHTVAKKQLAVSGFILFVIFSQAVAQIGLLAGDANKPRLLVLTDIGADNDDQQSLVRLLLYNHAFEIEGLLATSRLQYGYDTKPELIEKVIAAYAQVLPNLQQHHHGYAPAEALLQVVKSGLGDPTKMGAEWNSQASRWIVKTVETSDDRPIWICIWGGSRELAQALWSVRDRRNKKELAAFIKKIRVFCIEDQDRWGYWINKNFPELFYIHAGSCGDRSCQGFRGQYQTGDQSTQNAEWVENNIRQQHGALAALYPRNADRVNGMKECATPSFMYLYLNGLMQPDYPQWGGWGGRFQQDREGRFVDAMDKIDADLNERYAVSRWRPAFQRDFQARLDWCRTAARDSANHSPQVVVNGNSVAEPYYVNAAPGERIQIDASQSQDPDNDRLDFFWWIYPEAGGLQKAPILENAQSQISSLTLPLAWNGATVHVILEVTDDGLPPLTAYRRIILSKKK